MPIAELGYRHWEGRRVRPLLRWLAITRTEAGIAYRSSKLLRRFLMVAWVPLLYFGPLFFAVGYVADPQNELARGGFLSEMLAGVLSRPVVLELHAHPGILLPAIWSVVFFYFFTFTQILVMVVVAIVAPPLIARDARSKAFLIYFSKPIGFWDYLLGKAGVILAFVFAITLVPAFVLYAISIAFSPASGTLAETAGVMVRILLAALAIGVPAATVALLMSSLTTDRRLATFGWIAFVVLGHVAYRMILLGSEASPDFVPPVWAPLLSLREMSVMTASTIFDLGGHLADVVAEMQGLEVDPAALIRELPIESGPARQIEAALASTTGAPAPGGLSPASLAIGGLAALTALAVLVIRRRVSGPVRI